MAAFCIDSNSPLFKETAKRLGVSEFELEQIAYKYGNQEGTFGKFPSDEVIKASLNGVPNYNASKAQAKLWKLRYSTPREFDTIEELNEAKQEALRYFNDESVRFFLNSDGKYELRVGEQSYLESPERELQDAEDDANALTKKIIELEKQLRSKHIYESNISTSEGDIKVTISDTDKDANKDIIWLSSGRSIFGAVSMSIESNLKEGIIGGSILFPNISVSNRENNYVRISNPIRNKHAVILRQLLKQFIDAGKKYPVSKWQTETDFAPQQLKYKIDNLSSLLGIDVSEYFSQEERVFDFDEDTIASINRARSELLGIEEYGEIGGEVQERVVVDAQGLYDMLSILSGNEEFSAIEEAIQYNEAYNEASKIGFGKANKKNRKQLENELRSANKERDALWNKIRNLKDEVRRMKSSPWAFNAEEDLPFQKGQIDDTTQAPAVPKGYEYKVGYDNRIILHSTTFRPDRYNGPREIEYSFKDGEIYLQKWHKDARHGWYYEWKKATNPPADVKKFFEEYSANKTQSPAAPQTTGLPDRMTADEVYQRLSQQYAPDSSEAKLSKLVFDALQKTGIVFRGANMPKYWRGRFIASENVIEFNRAGILDNTLLHESIHAVTTYYMHAANTEGFSNDIKIAIKEIEECYSLLKEDFLDLHTKKGGDRNAILSFYTEGEYYGLKSSAELVAEITRPEIISLIRDYDARHKGQNIFQRLIDAIAKFFGITKKYGSLEKTLKDALVTLITHPDKALMDRYAIENRTANENLAKLNSASDAVTWNYKKDIESLLPEEFDSELDTELEVTISEVKDIVDASPEAHNIFTQSPIGTIFRVPSVNGYGWFLLNGSPAINGDIAKIPIKVINLDWLKTHTFDIATSQNGVAYMTNVKPLFGNVTQQDSQQGTQYVNHSGGARQADSYWGEIGEKYGVISKHYYHGTKTPNGNTVQSDADFKEGLTKVKKAAQDMGRVWSDKYADLLARNWNQVKYADEVFAVSSIVRAGERNRKGYLVRSLQVDGGTGYAVQMAINEGKPVHVFDQKTNQWYEYSYAQKDFIPTDTPTLSRNFAGIGTSTSLTDAGRKAIEDVYAKTFSQPQQQSQQTLDVWAGQNPTNADLSNFAYRPFTIPMGFQLPNGTYVSIPWQARNVEAAFQALKLNYTNRSTLEEEAENSEIQKAILSGRWQNEREDGAAVKRLGNKIKNLNQPAWIRDRQAIMKELIKMSFQQNPQALQRLLATGDAVLTHNRESSESIWRTEFPRILMEVRDELRREQGSPLSQQVSTQGKTEQYGVVIDSHLKTHQAQWQQNNPGGIVAYRVNYDKYNTPEEAQAGRIGNPFSEGQGQINKGIDTVQKFFEWITTGNNFGEVKATEEYRQAIIQRILNSPVGTPILYYTELGRPSHATILGYLINHKELIQNQVIQQAPEVKSQEEPMWAPPKVERDFHEREVTVVTQMNNLMNSGTITVTEITDEANKAMDWISDQLTQYIEDPEKVWSKYKSDENKEEVIAKVKGLSRKELVEYIGVDNIINIYANEIISPTAENSKLFSAIGRSGRAKYKSLKENINGLIQYGYSRFLAREGFGFQLSDVAGQTYTTTEEKSVEDRENAGDYNNPDTVDGNTAEYGNQQEHWVIESATRDIMENASVKVKQAIADCFVLEDNGKTNDDGSIKYDIATDSIKRNERVVPINAVRSIVRWTQGATTLSQMVAKLSAKVSTNPWISQIVTRLQDTTGNESDFQSQFFNTFCKHFQTYSIVKLNPDGTYYTMEVNVNPALKDAIDTIKVQQRVGGWILVNEDGEINTDARDTLEGLANTLLGEPTVDDSNREMLVDVIYDMMEIIGLPQSKETINSILTTSLKNKLFTEALNIVDVFKKAEKENAKGVRPFEYGSSYSIEGYVKRLIKPFTDILEDTMVSSVFDSGKMYQSYITPSWTTKLFQKMKLPDREFKKFVVNEFFSSEWFIDDKDMFADFPQDQLEGLSEEQRAEKILDYKIEYITSHTSKIRNPWLQKLWGMDEEARQEVFKHKVQLNFNKENYMRGMDDLTYVMSVFTEYYAESKATDKGDFYANFRFPMLSNKPSNEFVKFIRHTDIGDRERLGNGAKAILRGYYKIFLQEVSRIQTVEKRNLKKGDIGYIANFDIGSEGNKTAGNSFKFLDYLNDYLYGTKKNTELGRLLDRKLHAEDATEELTSDDGTRLEEKVKEEIANHLHDLADRLIARYKENGLFEALKKIEGIGTTDFDVTTAIREFAWNDNYAQANLLELLVTDKAFYKDEEDLQKRLAQVHSPGIRGNWEATDFEGNSISDGKLRVVKLADFRGKDVIQNVIENLEVVFNRKVAAAPEDQKRAIEDLRDNIIAAFRDINVVDGQAFVSPTAYRKKAIAFGEWTKEDEDVYKLLLSGKANLGQVKKVFNPRKPFTYGKTTKRVNAGLNTPIKNLRYGVQYKDSEYLLLMADAILKGEETGKPNLLGAIFDVMEESYKADPRQGIDFVVFDSGVKTGLQGAISINEFVNNPDGRALAKKKIMDAIYVDGKLGSSFNEDYVDILDAEDYTTQQTVPEHFMRGSLQWGSQIRALMPSDLETTYNGEDVVYEYLDPATGELQQKSAEEIRQLWEENTANMIKESIGDLRKELGLVDGMSIADSNVLISKILQREILSNPRYGVDLLLACSVDSEGNFRIPLGDPIQSKRVEQLLNSIVKNRVNKQKVAGGTLVEVTNFGTSKRLNIRFKDKNDATGKRLLDTKEEYLAKGHTEEEFKQYVNDNQGGIAYYECYAPAWTRDLFLKFADYKGNIDIEAIEMLDPDLLKMFGYRIPTEDKYSTAPYKIVGFLPQEAGDGFMQPWETTVIDGSDFDVDKKNLMRMVLNLKSSIMSKREFFEKNGLTEETEENVKKYNEYKEKEVLKTSPKEILKNLPSDLDIVTSADPAIVREAMVKAEKTIERRIAESKLEKAKQKAEDLKNKKTAKLLEQEGMHSEELEAITQEYNTIISNAEAAYRTRIHDIEEQEHTSLEREIVASMLRKRYLWQDSSKVPENERKLFLALKEAYLKTAFKVERPTLGKDYYNNLMFNMQWAIATHASTADKMLNPGNFDVQKRSGYMAEAYRIGHNWNKLESMEISGLKKLVSTSKNLMDFDVQTQFYKQNAVAGQILGIFAVAKSAHAMFEGRNYGINLENEFYIDGMKFGGIMPIDQKYDRTGTTLIGKTLGSLVGASADAVKDPVLNLMNINKETVNVLNTALRLGLDFQTAALLLSSSAVSRVLDNYRKNSLTKNTSFDKEVRAALRELEKKDYIGKDSALKRQNLTKEEMILSIRRVPNDASKEEIQEHNIRAYKILNAINGLSEASKIAQPITDVSRLNSITSAPGPLHINTLASDRKFGPAMKLDGIVKLDGKGGYQPVTREMIFDELPSLRAFYQGYDIVKDLFKRLNFTTASTQFRSILNAIPPSMEFSIYSKDRLLSSLADFFQSYLLVQNGVIRASDLKRYTTEFVTDYISGKYTTDEKVKNNPLIKAIQPKLISKKNEPSRYALSIDTTGMEQSEKDILSAGWAQLEKDDSQLSHMLFVYNFFRGGIGFSPKTFMALMPIQVKEKIGGYIETYTDLPEIDAHTVFDQWVRNNWTNTDLVPKLTNILVNENTPYIILNEKQAYLADRAAYLRISTQNGDFLFRQRGGDESTTYDRVEPLGNNREYLEMYPTNTKAAPIDNPQIGVVSMETIETEFAQQHESNPEVMQTQEEQTRELNDFYQIAYAEEGSDTERVQALDEKFEKANENLGIQTNKDKFDDIMSKFC